MTTTQKLKLRSINYRIKGKWSPREALLICEPNGSELRYLVAMQRADEIINKMMRNKV